MSEVNHRVPLWVTGELEGKLMAWRGSQLHLSVQKPGHIVLFSLQISPLKPRHFIFRGGRKNIILLEGSQATPARPSGRNNVKVKTLW
jgi:hypothetical protein